ncbi:MAG: MqnA/MqnD/SBP family protein, partial [Pirellula sp.]
MMAHRIRLGISTCPNDTFTFHALIHRLVDWRGLDFEVELLDIQQLNDRLFQRTLDVAKVSFHAALRLADQIWVLPTGSALGFGVGPLLLASAPNSRPLRRSQMTGCRENSAARSDAATNSAARSDAATNSAARSDAATNSAARSDAATT